VGSGLILLVIVGAWLAVLVPVALRSQESNTQTTVEAFHDAMRVLSRREGLAVAASPGEQPAPGGTSAASRRRRVLLVLVVVAVLSLLGAVAGPGWVLRLHLAADALLIGYLGFLRHTTVLRRERELRQRRRRPAVREPVAEAAGEPVRAISRSQDVAAVVAAARRAQARGAAAEAAVRARSRIAGVPDSMPSRSAVGTALYAVPVAAVGDVVEPARGAQGAAWSPVPVPLPAYLTAPVAPRRAPVVSRSDEGERRDEGFERKRAVND
jgi:hypothetical protein